VADNRNCSYRYTTTTVNFILEYEYMHFK